jgi:hypothetical protein
MAAYAPYQSVWPAEGVEMNGRSAFSQKVEDGDGIRWFVRNQFNQVPVSVDDFQNSRGLSRYSEDGPSLRKHGLSRGGLLKRPVDSGFRRAHARGAAIQRAEGRGRRPLSGRDHR